MTEAERSVCVAWVRAHAHTWQVLNRAQWNYRFRGKALVRYVEEAQMRESEVRLLLEYLSSDECIATLSLYDQSVSADWKPIRAWFEMSNKSVGSVRAVRLYHGLRTDPEGEADGPYVVEDGCAYRVSLTYYWSVPEIAECPKSESGVGYRIVNLTRDQETGLYTYAVERRERVRQDIAEYVSSETSFATTKDEQHLGVRAEDVAETGKAASAGGGTMVRRKLTKNADCTTDVANETVVERPVAGAVTGAKRTLRGTVRTTVDRNQASPAPTSGLGVGDEVRSEMTPGGLYDVTRTSRTSESAGRIAESCRKTAFGHSHETLDNVARKPAAEAANAGGGKTHEKSVRQTDEGTWDVTERTAQETAVAGASETVSVSLTGTTTRTVNRSMAAKAATSGLGVGQSVTNEMTEGGRWTQTIVRLVRNALLKVSETCRRTIFEHVHATVNVQSNNPGAPDASAGGGVTVERTVERTEDGAYRVKDQTTEEQGVANAVVTTRKTLRGTTVTTLDRNQPSPASAANLPIGGEVHVEKTPGGLYNNRVTTARNDAAGKIAASCENSGGVTHRDTSVENVARANAPMGTHVAASANVVTRVTSRVQENGTVDVETAMETHSPVSTGEMSAGSEKAKVTVKAGINQVQPPSPGAGAQNVVRRVSATPNGHGSFTTSETTETYSPATATHEAKWATETASTTVTRHDTTTDKKVSGEYGETSATPDDNGAATTSVTTYTPKEHDSGWIEWDSVTKTANGEYKYHNGYRIFCNQKKIPDRPTDHNLRLSVHYNKFGLYDGSMSYSDLYDWAAGGGGSGEGGSNGGTAKLAQYMEKDGKLWVRFICLPTRAYHGRGNEGSENSDKANEVFVAGINLPARTYGTKDPTYTEWKETPAPNAKKK